MANRIKAAFADFSITGRALFGGIYDDVISHIARGEIAEAKLVIQMVAIPAEVNGVPAEEIATWSIKINEIIAIFP